MDALRAYREESAPAGGWRAAGARMSGWLWAAVLVCGWVVVGTVVAFGVGAILRAADRRLVRHAVLGETAEDRDDRYWHEAG